MSCANVYLRNFSMKKTTIISILAISLVGVIYLGFLAMGGNNREMSKDPQDGNSQLEDDLLERSDEVVGNDGLADNEGSGISIDKDLLNRKMEISDNGTEKDSLDSLNASPKEVATSSKAIATSTKAVEPEIASTTGDVETASSSIAKPLEITPETSIEASTTGLVSE